MSRLTERDKEACDLCNLDCKHMDNSCEKAKLYNKLAHYEDLEEQGRLIELPCKVGDTVYIIATKCQELPCADGHEMDCANCDYWETHIVAERKFTASMLMQMGKTAFLTKEEAEAKLEEKKRGAE